MLHYGCASAMRRLRGRYTDDLQTALFHVYSKSPDMLLIAGMHAHTHAHTHIHRHSHALARTGTLGSYADRFSISFHAIHPVC